MRSSAPLVVLALLALAPACSREPPPTPPASAAPPTPTSAPAAAGLPDRDPALAHKLVAAGGVLVDVRTPEEFATRHLDGAVNIPVDELKTRLGEVDKLTGGDKDKPIVVYCQSGGRAGRAKTVLLGAGHPQVTNLGGIGDWDRR
jgi:phage shock protein E